MHSHMRILAKFPRHHTTLMIALEVTIEKPYHVFFSSSDCTQPDVLFPFVFILFVFEGTRKI